jgi:O-antigen/teichoic acid export membrane protein
MITWLNIMDIGLSNGLRNKITETNTTKNFELGRTYVSTTYAILALISVVGLLLCFLLIYTLHWENILPIPKDMSLREFRMLLIIISSSFFLTFLLKPIASVAYANHKAYLEYLILLLSNFFNLLAIWLLVIFQSKGSIVQMAVCFCFTPLLVTFLLTVGLFRKNFRAYSPKFSKIDFSHARELMALSGRFFIIQIAATVVFTTNNFLISHYFGNEEVTQYNIAFRYFNIIVILQSMILVPFWAIFTEGYTEKNAGALKNNMTKLLKMTAWLSLFPVLMLLICNPVYHVWIGDLVQIPLSLSMAMCFYVLLMLYSSTYTIFINGTGKIKLQMMTSILSSTLHIPLAILLIKYFHFNYIGVIMASSFWLLFTLPLRHIQYKKLISFSSIKTIWNK